jgi:hypothetical protein
MVDSNSNGVAAMGMAGSGQGSFADVGFAGFLLGIFAVGITHMAIADHQHATVSRKIAAETASMRNSVMSLMSRIR